MHDTCSITGPTWSFKTEPDPGIILSWSDNFDTYTAGSRLACQNPTNWTTWTLAPCSSVEDALISNATIIWFATLICYYTELDLHIH